MSQALDKYESNVGDTKDRLTGCTPPKAKNVRMDCKMEDSGSEKDVKQTSKDWCGVSLQHLKSCKLKEIYPPVVVSASHTVLFKLPVVAGKLPDPYPTTPVDVWNKDYVRLPHSSHSLCPTAQSELKRRWDLIREAFSKPITCSDQLEAAILHYNSKYAEKWKFKSLGYFFNRTLEEEESEYFFDNVLPGIVRLALSLPELITTGIPLLQQKQTHSISLTQKQIACLLANAFLCTFPRRNTTKTHSEYKNYPDINFNRLFSFGYGDHCQEKLKCIVNYFRRVCSKCPEGVVTFSRHYVSSNDLPMWSESSSLLPDLHVTSAGTIEDEGTGMMELDFANKFVGGGVLGRGCVQEEIRFVICPELIVARLFTECLGDTEALIVTGVERFSNYKGYASSFTWAGDVKDKTPRDRFARLQCVIVAVDAVHFQHKEKQYSPQSINRELNKAYAGFSWGMSCAKQTSLNVATGNWGCGAFGGHAQLKALLQLMAAGQVNRSVAYFTFGDPELRDDLSNMHRLLVGHTVTIGELWKLLSSYHSSGLRKWDLYTYIYHTITNGAEGLQSCSSSTFVSKPKSILPDVVESVDVPLNSESGGLTSAEISATLAALEDSEDFKEAMETESVDVCETGCKQPSNSCATGEPKEAKSYSVRSKEGRDRCIQRQKDSWARIEESKKDFSQLDIVDDDDDSQSVSSRTDASKDNSTSKIKCKDSSCKRSPAVAKRKISDYFSSSPKT